MGFLHSELACNLEILNICFSPLSPWHTWQVNATFACELTTKYHEQVLEAIITLVAPDIHLTHDGVSEMI